MSIGRYIDLPMILSTPFSLCLPPRGEASKFRAALQTSPEIPGSLPLSGSDRKSTRLNSSHQIISYAVFCLKKKKNKQKKTRGAKAVSDDLRNAARKLCYFRHT